MKICACSPTWLVAWTLKRAKLESLTIRIQIIWKLSEDTPAFIQLEGTPFPSPFLTHTYVYFCQLFMHKNHILSGLGLILPELE